MQIVIDIPEEMYKRVCDLDAYVLGDADDILIENAIANGTPLPKGHGRLIDADMLDDVIMQMNENGSEITRYEYKMIDDVLFEMQTIIKADKAESEDKE